MLVQCAQKYKKSMIYLKKKLNIFTVLEGNLEFRYRAWYKAC